MRTINKKTDPCAIDNAFCAIADQYRHGKASLELLNFRQADKLKLLTELKEYGIHALLLDDTKLITSKRITG